jgi:hypothetical protein
LTLNGSIRVWHILLGTALTSALNIVLNPTRMALISKLVPRSHLTNAVSLNSSVSQAANFIGPMVAGVSIEWMDIGNSYLFNALFYLPAAVSIVLIQKSGAPDGKKEPFSFGSFLGGLRFLFSEPIVLAMVMLDFIVIGVGYYRSLLPIFAKDILLLALWSFLAYALGVGFFALSTNFWLSAFLLGALGLVNALQAVMRQTTFHLLTPDAVRGRAFAVFNMFSQGAKGQRSRSGGRRFHGCASRCAWFSAFWLRGGFRPDTRMLGGLARPAPVRIRESALIQVTKERSKILIGGCSKRLRGKAREGQ